jgi:hypothetical protein
VADGYVYGDFQYAIDSHDESFLRRGVMSCYKPAPDDAFVDDQAADLSKDDWLLLLESGDTGSEAIGGGADTGMQQAGDGGVRFRAE